MITMKERRCFIISAFGRDDAPPGSELRIAWDRASFVIKSLIAPAIELVNETIEKRGEPPLTYHRGDYTRDTRPIIDDIHKNILTSTINIAALITRNENVGYEIGVANAFGKPVILLRHEDYTPPYDLAHLRMVLFKQSTFESEEAREKVVQQLVGVILAKVPNFRAPNFEPSLLGGDVVPQARCIAYDRFRVAYTDWDEMFWEAEKQIWIAGITLDQVANVNRFRRPVVEEDREDLGLEPVIDGVQQYVQTGLIDSLIAQCQAGRDVNVVIMHEDNPALAELLRHPTRNIEREIEKVRLEIVNTSQRVTSGIKLLAELARQLGASIGNFRFTKVMRGLIANRVSMSDSSAYITPVSFTLDINSGPCFLVSPLSPAEKKDRHGKDHGDINLFDVTRADLAFLQRINPTMHLDANGRIIDGLAKADQRMIG